MFHNRSIGGFEVFLKIEYAPIMSKRSDSFLHVFSTIRIGKIGRILQIAVTCLTIVIFGVRVTTYSSRNGAGNEFKTVVASANSMNHSSTSTLCGHARSRTKRIRDESSLLRHSLKPVPFEKPFISIASTLTPTDHLPMESAPVSGQTRPPSA